MGHIVYWTVSNTTAVVLAKMLDTTQQVVWLKAGSQYDTRELLTQQTSNNAACPQWSGTQKRDDKFASHHIVFLPHVIWHLMKYNEQ